MSSVAERIAKRGAKSEKANKPKTNWGAAIKRKMLKWTAITAVVATSPYTVELGVTKYQESQIKDSLDYMVQNRAAQCDAGVPQSLTAQYQQKMIAIVHNDLVYQKQDPLAVSDIYKSGLKRLGSYVPFRAKLAELSATYANFTVPQSFLQDGYQTKTGELAQQGQALAEMGAGICFDATLGDKKYGSGFTASKAVITLDPNLDDTILAVHLSRQFNLAHQNLVVPFNKFANDLSDGKMHIDQVQQMKQMADEILSDQSQVIPTGGDPKTAEVKTTKRYQAKLKSPAA